MFWKKVVAAGVLLLLGYSSALWRYRTNSKNYAIFSTRTTIHLEYEGPNFIEWEAPVDCDFSNRSLPKTEMLCEVEGVHIIRPKILGKSEEAEKRYLFVDRPTECFLWYYQSSQVTNKSLQNIMMWIYDPENAGPDELYNNASYPSVNSRSITRQFLSMGEDPLVVSGISFEVYYPEVNKREGYFT